MTDPLETLGRVEPSSRLQMPPGPGPRSLPTHLTQARRGRPMNNSGCRPRLPGGSPASQSEGRGAGARTWLPAASSWHRVARPLQREKRRTLCPCVKSGHGGHSLHTQTREGCERDTAHAGYRWKCTHRTDPFAVLIHSGRNEFLCNLHFWKFTEKYKCKKQQSPGEGPSASPTPVTLGSHPAPSPSALKPAEEITSQRAWHASVFHTHVTARCPSSPFTWTRGRMFWKGAACSRSHTSSRDWDGGEGGVRGSVRRRRAEPSGAGGGGGGGGGR